jgi:formyltetrahydrofolate deformylase
MRVDHTLSGDGFVRLGKDVENTVLARAAQWQTEHRVMLNGHRTVIFR